MSRHEIATDTEDLLAYEEDGVAVITLNRPQARNAMSGEMNAGLAKALEYAETAASVRAIVLTGAGGAFCAGGDVKGMAAGGGGQGPTLDERIHAQRLNQRNTAGRMYMMPKPVVASLPGPAAGAGLALALAADLRIMSDNAFITSAFCPGRLQRRLRRQLLPLQSGRQRQSQRAVFSLGSGWRGRMSATGHR